MARKPIEIFSVSFLDLLSGALGAVILLYVIVPRLSISVEESAEQEKLSRAVEALGLRLGDLKNLVTKDQYEKVERQMKAILQAKNQLESRIDELQRRIKDCNDNKASSAEEMASLQQQLAAAQEGLKKCESDFERLEGQGRFILVTMNWTGNGEDVDLHVRSPDGHEFFYNAKTFPGVPGELTLDNTAGPGLEVWAVADPTPGHYAIYANLYARHGNGENPRVQVTVYHRNGVMEFPVAVLSTEDAQAGAPNKKLIGSMDVPDTGPIMVN